VPELLAAASRNRVRLRTARRSEAMTVLAAAGATVAATGPETVVVTDLSAEDGHPLCQVTSRVFGRWVACRTISVSAQVSGAVTRPTLCGGSCRGRAHLWSLHDGKTEVRRVFTLPDVSRCHVCPWGRTQRVHDASVTRLGLD
jgi:hypothetical protein